MNDPNPNYKPRRNWIDNHICPPNRPHISWNRADYKFSPYIPPAPSANELRAAYHAAKRAEVQDLDAATAQHLRTVIEDKPNEGMHVRVFFRRGGTVHSIALTVDDAGLDPAHAPNTEE